MNLRNMQRDFTALIQAAPNGDESGSHALFNGDAKSIARRLDIYRYNIRQALVKRLNLLLPATAQLLGSEYFNQNALLYIDQYPSVSGNIHNYGYMFDDFILSLKDLKNKPYIYDMARFEIALDRSEYAENDNFLNDKFLKSILPEAYPDLMLNLRNSVHLISSDYPLEDLRSYCLDQKRADHFDLDRGGCRLMVTRPAHDVRVVHLQPDEYDLLTFLKAGLNFGAAFHKVIQSYGDFKLTDFLSRHLELKTFKNLSPSAAD